YVQCPTSRYVPSTKSASPAAFPPGKPSKEALADVNHLCKQRRSSMGSPLIASSAAVERVGAIGRRFLGKADPFTGTYPACNASALTKSALTKALREVVRIPSL